MGVQEKFLNNYMSIKFPIISIDYYQIKRRSSENIETLFLINVIIEQQKIIVPCLLTESLLDEISLKCR